MNRMEAKTQVSVIIPTYNRGWTIGEAVDSVLAQDYRDFELIVVDDGSTDNTPQVLDAYSGAIKVFRQENKGVSAARNRGISEASGRFIAFDSDYWRETAQRSLLVEPGGPGAVTIYGNDSRMHREYSEHICNEQLAEKVQFADGSKVYRWTHKPGEHWDYLDSAVGCFVGATVGGLTQGPSRPAPRRYVETRKPKIEIQM